MILAIFLCPLCKGALAPTETDFHCPSCDRTFQVVRGVPDFFVAESGHDFSHDPNVIWLDPQIVEARDTIYRLCTCELKGMAFCMREIGQRTGAGCRVLDVGMGTGHFTRWLAEVVKPGTEVYAFDFSWPIIEKAKANVGEGPNVMLFRANAREPLPFPDGTFDIVLTRLAPLGPHGVPNVVAAFKLLKPGGWYFSAGWERERYETPPTDWALQHGYESAEYHVWQYSRVQTEEEYNAWQIEQRQLVAMRGDDNSKVSDSNEHQRADLEYNQDCGRGIVTMTCENVLIAQKPA